MLPLVVRTPPVEPMLARPVEHLPRRPGLSYEAKWDGFRAVCFAVPGRICLQARRGSDLSSAFPEIARAAGELAGVGTCVLDGELVVAGEAGRLDFELLAARARRSGRRAAESAAQTPAHFVAFDLLQLGEEVTMQLPCRRRRELLEDLFARQQLAAPWTLCPATADPEQAQEWLSPEWAAVGIEGCLARTGRGWRGHRPDHLPHTVLLARYDPSGRMRLVARSTPLSRPLRREHRGPRAGETSSSSSSANRSPKH